MKRVIGQTVSALSTTIEYRDPYTHDHQKRVAKLAAALVEAMNLDSETMHEVTVAAHLHDLGKVTIPEAVLNKPGSLTPEEFNTVKTHSQAGYDIIKQVEFPWPIADIVLQHHEKINGSGYPLGLKGDDILLSARILCVADVIEAMTSNRSHRKAKTIEEALTEIRNNKGILYDAKVVEACLRLFEEKHFQFDE
jgi:putative nucleotidyltransferase with HDIG domain